MRPLTGDEIEASKTVHPAGLIPYGSIRVDEDSNLIKIGNTLGTWLGSDVLPGAITTMHIIHLPVGGVARHVMMHELTHVCQYELVGAIYMPEAIHAQQTAGYDYGDISQPPSVTGRHYADMNREQQAQIVEDYWALNNHGTAEKSGTKETLQPYMDEEMAGKF